MKSAVIAFLRRSAPGRLALRSVATLLAAVRGRGYGFGRFPRYRAWIRTAETRGRDMAAREDGPPISVLIPAFNPRPADFAAMIASLDAQTWRNWEAVICDDASSDPNSRRALEAVNAHARVRVIRRAANGGIAAATNAAIAEARGDILCFLDQDDVLAPDALALVADAFAANPGWRLVYTDEDKLDRRGRRTDPYFKPDFDRALLYRRNYINHLTAARTDLARGLGGLRDGYDGAQDYDFVLRALERAGPDGIGHIPRIAYHWRTGEWAGGFSQRRAGEAASARAAALRDHLERIGQAGAEVTPGHIMSVRWPVPAGQALTAIIPTRDKIESLARCVAGLRADAAGFDLRIVILDNDSREAASRRWLFEAATAPDVTVIPAPGPFNFSRLVNIGARAAESDLLLLLNNDIYGGRPGWLAAMAGEALRPWAGAVGAKLLYPDGRLQHGGVVLGPGGSAGHFMKGAREDDAGPFGHLRTARTASAVTAACLMIRRDVFDAVGGFDEEEFPIGFSDVDFCLRVRAAGYDNVWTPDAVLIHEEGATRGREDADHPRFREETARLRARWEALIDRDPYLNPNLRQAEWADLRWD